MIFRSPKLLERINQAAQRFDAPCFLRVLCDGVIDQTVTGCHSNQGRDGKGRGIKAHDYRIALGCFRCHYEIDQGSKMSDEQRIEAWERAHRETIGWLFDKNILMVR